MPSVNTPDDRRTPPCPTEEENDDMMRIRPGESGTPFTDREDLPAGMEGILMTRHEEQAKRYLASVLLQPSFVVQIPNFQTAAGIAAGQHTAVR